MMVRNSTGHNGTIDTNRLLAALMLRRNKPDQGTGLSSSEVIFGRNMKDKLPYASGKLQVKAEWYKHHEAPGACLGW